MYAAALPAAGPAPPCFAKPARAGDQRIALGFHGDHLLHLLLHRRPQQPGRGPFIATASDDASHEAITRHSRMVLRLLGNCIDLRPRAQAAAGCDAPMRQPHAPGVVGSGCDDAVDRRLYWGWSFEVCYLLSCFSIDSIRTFQYTFVSRR